MDMNNTWIIVEFDSQSEIIDSWRVEGDKEQVKKFLIEIMNDYRTMDYSNYDFGSETVDEISEDSDGKLFAHVTFENYHMNFFAIPDKKLIDLNAERRKF